MDNAIEFVSMGNSISHYLIDFITFILSNQENKVPTAVLACMIDFSQAFDRQNHNILITKLSDMGVPAWLLRIVVRFKGATSSVKSLPRGGPQGTLLGLLLFIGLRIQRTNKQPRRTHNHNLQEHPMVSQPN